MEKENKHWDSNLRACTGKKNIFNMKSDDLLYNAFLKSNSEMFRAQFQGRTLPSTSGTEHWARKAACLTQCGISYDLYTLLGHTTDG